MNNTSATRLEKVAEADFPTQFGAFRIFGFRMRSPKGLMEEAVVLKMGELAGEPPLVRIHSQCLTGDVFHSLRCDCRAQLDAALSRIAREGRGVLVYLVQEGRGIGLGNKVRAYHLQDDGHDTVEANLALGFAADDRSYDLAAGILRELGVTSVRLMTNNPKKRAGLEQAGVKVDALEAHWVGESEHNADYLEAKRLKLGHLP